MVVYGTPKGGAPNTMKMLLHACCGPCSVEPVRILLERGADITIAFANSNIAPQQEYDHRLATLKEFAAANNIPVIEAAYKPETWEATAGKVGETLARSCDITDFSRDIETVSELLDDKHRQARCRLCYRGRLREAAQIARDGGFDTLATTLAVSPYQFTQVIEEELDAAASDFGLTAFFEDWRPFYEEGTARSRDLGMYRQNYCGCRFSIAEGEATRAFIRHRQAQRKQEQRTAHAAEREAAEAARRERAAERKAYNQKQERKRAVLKALRNQRAADKKEDESKNEN